MRAVLALFDTQDIGGAAIGDQQIGAIRRAAAGRPRRRIGPEGPTRSSSTSPVQSLGAEHGVQNVVACAIGAKLDDQAFDDEFKHRLDSRGVGRWRPHSRRRKCRRDPFSRMIRITPNAARRSA